MKKYILAVVLCLPLLAWGQRHTKDTVYFAINASRLIDSKVYSRGNTCIFEVAEDVYIGDSLIIEQGAKAYGTVTMAQKADLLGKQGILEITPNYVEGIYRDYNLGGPLLYSEGNSRRPLACFLTLLSPVFLLIRGQEAHIYPDTKIHVFLDPR